MHPELMHIQSLRGLACLLLVLFHVVGDTPWSGLRLPVEHDLQLFNQVLIYWRMPLFAAIAGYVYALRPAGPDWGRFLSGKARRLLLPLLTVGTAFATLQALTPGTNAQPEALWEILVLPTAHFWFLQALFLVFIAAALLERLGLLGSARQILLMAAISAVLFLVTDPPSWFSMENALYLLQYFLLGVAARRVGMLPRAGLLAMGLALLGIALAVLTSDRPLWPKQSLVSLALGSLGTWLLLSLPWQHRWLVRLGEHSYAIFLFHVFFTAATRMALQRLGVDELPALVAAGMTAGILGPIAVGLAIARMPWAATLLMGAKPPARAGREFSHPLTRESPALASMADPPTPRGPRR